MRTFVRCKPVRNTHERARKYHLFPAVEGKLFLAVAGESLCQVWSQQSTINCGPQLLVGHDFSGQRPHPYECAVCHHHFQVLKGGAA